MTTISIILGVLGIIIFLGLLSWFLITIRIEGCKNCPLQKECMKPSEPGKDFVPKCYDYENPFFNRFH